MPSLYRFSDYSPDWPLEFEREAERLELLLGGELAIVHHIGSTSVPGLAAKPVIDLLPLVRDITRLDHRTPVLVRAGYQVWGEYGLLGRRFFTRDLAGYRTHNIHIYPIGHPDVDRHLAFCAYLRSNGKLRQEYEILKRKAYARHPADIGAYNDAKAEWIRRVEQIALQWYRRV